MHKAYLLNHPEQIRLKLLPRLEELKINDHILIIVCPRIAVSNDLGPLPPRPCQGIRNPALAGHCTVPPKHEHCWH